MKTILRLYHRKLSLIVALPLVIVAISGCVLLLRGYFDWIQPKSVSAEILANAPLLTFEKVVQDNQLTNDDIDQVIYRPQKSNLSIRYKSGFERQVHPQTGKVLGEGVRRTNFLIELHQGTIFGKYTSLLIFLPAGIILLFLIISGVVIYPYRRD